LIVRNNRVSIVEKKAVGNDGTNALDELEDEDFSYIVVWRFK
jgi:hypothetical protein